MPDTTHYLLWLDLETTGLRVEGYNADTILETSWFLTDAARRPLTPLRSRYCAIAPTDGRPNLPNEMGGWDHNPHAVVVDMHRESGLRDDHYAAQEARLVVTSGDVLAALITEDVRAAIGPEPAAIHLAGDGVTNLDARMIMNRMPTLLADGGNSALLHYAAHDTSQYLRVLLGHDHDAHEQVIGLNAPAAAAALRELTIGRYPTFGMPGDRLTTSTFNDWVFAGKGRHRAAPDVVTSWLVDRVLYGGGRAALNGQVAARPGADLDPVG